MEEGFPDLLMGLSKKTKQNSAIKEDSFMKLDR